MSLTFGFYNSVSGDRVYSADQLSSIFEGMIHDGVFEDIGDKFAVTEAAGMNVNVGTGRAWFNNTWTKNDTTIVLAVDAAHAVFDRYDVVVLEVDASVGVRTNSIKIVKGTASSDPQVPALTNAGDVHQYALAVLVVEDNATTIGTANIFTIVGTVDCPYVTGILRDLDTVALEDAVADVAALDTKMDAIYHSDTPIITTGSANAYVVTYTDPIPTAYTNMAATITVHAANTGASTINFNSLGVKDMKKLTAAGKAALADGDMVTNGIYRVVYDGTDVLVLNPTSILASLFTAAGDLMYASAAKTLARLPIDADATKIMGIVAGLPAWIAYPGAEAIAGSYTGNGASNRDISLGFTPLIVFVGWSYGGTNYFSIGHFGGGVTGINTYGNSTDSSVRSAYAGQYIPQTGTNKFTVTGSSATDINQSGVTYYYTAIG
jgi:hypothetical protein